MHFDSHNPLTGLLINALFYRTSIQTGFYNFVPVEQTNKTTASFSGYQKFALFILAITQFTVILDFMVISPLGDILMKSLSIKPAHFGLAVSAYAFSAGFSGLLTAGFADKFDRKKLLLFFYIGFIVGTFLCGIANTYTSR